MKRNLTLVVAAFAAAALLSFGCGGAGPANDYSGPTTEVYFSGGAGGAGQVVMVTSESPMFDAGAGSTGSGDDGDGIDSINDSVTPSCAFDIPALEHCDGLDQTTCESTDGCNWNVSVCEFVYGESDNGYVFVVEGASSAACDTAGVSKNNCVFCQINTVASPNCNIICSGTIPSNADVEADSISIGVSFTHLIESDMPQVFDDGVDNILGTSDDIGGVLRFDGAVYNWSEFDASSISYDVGLCDGTDSVAGDIMKVFEAGFVDPLSLSGLGSTSAWLNSYGIETLDNEMPAAQGQCTIVQSMQAVMVFENAQAAGTPDDVTPGEIALVGSVCDDPTNCPYPCSELDGEADLCGAMVGCVYSDPNCNVQ